MKPFLTFCLNRNTHSLHPASPILLPVSPSKTHTLCSISSKQVRNKKKKIRGQENPPGNPAHLIIIISSRFVLPKLRTHLFPPHANGPPLSPREREREHKNHAAALSPDHRFSSRGEGVKTRNKTQYRNSLITMRVSTRTGFTACIR